MIRKAARFQGLLTIWVLVLFGRVGAAQPEPSWVRHGGDADAFDLVASPAGTVTIVGSGTFGTAGSFFEDVTVDVHDSTAVAIATYAADGTLVWGRQGAFRGKPGPGGFLGSVIQGFVGAVDTQGNFFTAEGYPYAIDSDMLGGGGVSVNKYAPDGTARWSVPIHPPVAFPDDQPGFVVSLGIDPAERLYVGGFFRDTLILAPDTLVAFPHEPRADDDVFLASYDADGTLRWSRRIGGPRRDFFTWGNEPYGPFAVDGDGNTYLGGRFGAGARFGEGQPGERTLADDAYALASYDATGTLRWVRTASDLRIGEKIGPRHLVVDAAGNLVVNWYVERSEQLDTVTVGDATFYSGKYGSELLTKLSPEGAILWARQLVSAGNLLISDVVTDPQGHVYVSGEFDGLYLRLEGRWLVKQELQADRLDGFVAHYDAEGALRWTLHVGGEDVQRVNALAVSETGELYVAGEFAGTLQLGRETLETYAGGFDLFVAKYEAATITAVEEAPEAVPGRSVRVEAYPNPSRGRATIRYEVAVPGPVRLVVYDVLGRAVAVLVDREEGAGWHEADFDATGLASGVYLYRLEAAGRTATGTLLLRK